MGQQLAPLGFGQAVGLQPLDHMELALLGHEGRTACKTFHAACRLAMLIVYHSMTGGTRITEKGQAP